MKTLGVRDLTNKLSEYFRRVRLGYSVLVTDRGEVVATPARTNLYPALRRREGELRRSVAQLLDEERGPR
jgi:prevent-host-death family protein